MKKFFRGLLSFLIFFIFYNLIGQYFGLGWMFFSACVVTFCQWLEYQYLIYKINKEVSSCQQEIGKTGL